VGWLPIFQLLACLSRASCSRIVGVPDRSVYVNYPLDERIALLASIEKTEQIPHHKPTFHSHPVSELRYAAGCSRFFLIRVFAFAVVVASHVGAQKAACRLSDGISSLAHFGQDRNPMEWCCRYLKLPRRSARSRASLLPCLC
jgi:hypothetical protein